MVKGRAIEVVRCGVVRMHDALLGPRNQWGICLCVCRQDVFSVIQQQQRNSSVAWRGVWYGTVQVDMCEPLAEAIRHAGVNAVAFNAKLNSEEKAAVLDGWRNSTINFVVATIAFGMGIDRPNVRRVIHWNMSKCIEA